MVLSNIYTHIVYARNKFMFDHSSTVIACFNGKSSGTGNTIKYAKEKGLKIRINNPEFKNKYKFLMLYI